MNRPYIICHMVESIDGRIDCHMVDHISGVEYYSTLSSLECNSSIEGRATMEKYYSLPSRFKATDSVAIGKESFFKGSEGTDFHICPDTNGVLLWERGTMEDGRNLLVVTSENVSAEYLNYLKSKGISYICTGKEKIDLPRAMEILADDFGVKRLAVLGGGLINGAFLAERLLDEVSLLIAPGIDGRSGQRALFDGITDEAKLPTRLKILNIERLDNDVVWLRYSCTE